MVYKFTSAKEVVAKIYSDLDIQEELHRITDIREWITEAIEKIGAFDQFVKKVITVPIVDYKVRIPDDLHSLVQCAYSFDGTQRNLMPMTKATGSFDCWDADRYWVDRFTEYGPSLIYRGDAMQQLIHLVRGMYSVHRPISDNEAKDIIMRLADGDVHHDYHEHDIHVHRKDDEHDEDEHHEHNHDHHHHDPHLKHRFNHVLPVLMSMINTNIAPDTITARSARTNFKPVYTLNKGFINTNVRYGFLTIAYQAFNVDDEGFPMIPDIASYKEAVYWYVAMKLKFPEVLRGTLNAQLYAEIKNNWHIYRKQAYGECTMPDTDELQTMQNNWQRLVPEIEENLTFFTHSGDEQEIYNQTNRPYYNYRHKGL